MLRALVVLLLLANLALLAWTQGWFDRLTGPRNEPGREPERLQRQVNPGAVTVLSAQAASAALAAASRAVAASEAAAASAAAASAAEAAGTCLEAGPIPASAQAGAEKLLHDTGIAAGRISTVPGERKGVFLIYMGKYADDETLERKVEELKRLKIEGQPMQNAPDLQPGLVLGRFDDKGAAEAELGRLSQRGLRTARVLTLVPPVPLVTLRVQADEAQRGKLATLKLPNNGPGFSPCGAAAKP